LLLVLGLPAVLVAAPPWTSFLPFKRAEADPRQSYELQDHHGPWLILAASFAGEGAEQQAHDLARELRGKYQLSAYLFREEYDFTDSVEGRGLDKYGERQRMRYANSGRYDAIGVLVGDFPAVDDPALQKTLDKLKYAQPECLDLTKHADSTQQFAGLRSLYRRLNGDEAKRRKGPMGSAFVTRNPLLPAEYFEGGVDPFVVSLNRGVKYSLLDNAGQFTVRVATFRGDITMDANKIQALEQSGNVTDKLEVAADQAHRLTTALRKRGVDAYEFHDRHESIVTIGSFASEGTPRADGTIEIDPGILRIMQSYGASRQRLPGRPELGLQPRQLAGIPFDVQPYPMKVPRQSLGASYTRQAGFFR
jgi:hypothetical protein